MMFTDPLPLSRRPATWGILLTSFLVFTACGSGSGGPSHVPPTAMAFSPNITHPYFPIHPGALLTYEGTKDGLPVREVVSAIDDRRIILDVECSSVHEDVYVDGELTEVTTHWYAQDSLGNVWKFGEESWEFDNGAVTLSDDSWIASNDGAAPWREFVLEPHAGDVFVGYRPDGHDYYHVISTTAVASVPAGEFSDCLEIHENPDDPDDSDIILYSRGIGRVAEYYQGGGIELVSAE